MNRLEQVELWNDQGAAPSRAASAFRPIHYLGSKLRLVGEICAAVDALDPSAGPAVDLFAGSGTVALALSRSRSVTAVDVQEYSRVLCSALLTQTRLDFAALTSDSKFQGALDYSPLGESIQPMVEYEAECLRHAAAGRSDALCELLDAGSIFGYQRAGPPSNISNRLLGALRESCARLSAAGLGESLDSLITRYYGGIYFSYKQAASLDLLLAASARVGPQSDAALAIVLSTASDVVNTVGKHFAQPLRLRKKNGSVKTYLLAKVAKDRSLDVGLIASSWAVRYASLIPSPFPSRALRADYGAFLEADRNEAAVLYADPPYTRDHYSRYYHILETMARRDLPEVSQSNLGQGMLSRGLYREDRYQSPFCIKSQAPEAFDRLFALARSRRIPLVVSYSPFDITAGAHPRLMSIDAIVALAKARYRRVEVCSVGRFAHSKLNSSENALAASDQAEVLILCRP